MAVSAWKVTAESAINSRIALLDNPKAQPTLLPTSIAPACFEAPPVTRAAISDVDIDKLISNPSFRHDINFDPQLRVRPLLYGKKNRMKKIRANQYWHSLKEVLAMFTMDRPGFYAVIGHVDDWALPTLLKTIGDIIATVISPSELSFFKEGFNVELLMQQLHKNCADLEKLAGWLAQFLKTHCPPMRDQWIDTMYKHLSNGNRTSDLREVVNGLRSLLGVVEAMVLDDANHRIRCLRPRLIESTICFEQQYFRRRICSGEMDTFSAQHWYNEAVARFVRPARHSSHFGETGAFFEALCRLIMPSSMRRCLPSTFLFDESRIQRLRSDMLEAINLNICMGMYEDLKRNDYCATSGHFASPTADEATVRRSTSPGAEFNFNTPLESSRPSNNKFRPPGVPTLSKDENRRLYRSLVDLLQSAEPEPDLSTRWRSILPSMALEIHRAAFAHGNTLGTFENKVFANVGEMDSVLHRRAQESFQTRLMVELGICICKYRHLSALELFSAATGSFQTYEHDQNRDMVKDIAVRLAHLGILHWRVHYKVYMETAGEGVDLETKNRG
ncbi:T-complex 11 [Akanthomyces lecanii RCEF 1005]|uniref:T-complex 11 n=1 Tax=Akanthomyces lecanii RCEF 1005 TaxID=1081108 RepID=A0A167XKD1_CORDF|nr:T-complex 11 [Akanthomyces lecanii RCEF 1005]